MIRLNKLTDYAVVVLAQMANDTDAVVTAPKLARDTGVPAPTVAKLLKALVRAEILTSQRGAGGGYVLGQAASDITVADIISALEGPISLTACVDGNDLTCEVETLCPMRGNWDKVNRAIRNALESVTLAEMADMQLPFAPPPASPASPAIGAASGR